MPKRSQIDKAIDALRGEILVLELAISKLVQQRAAPKRTKKPRAVVSVEKAS